MLVKITTKHAVNSPVMLVTRKPFFSAFMLSKLPGGGALGYFLGGWVPPGTPNWHPVLEKISPKIDTPF